MNKPLRIIQLIPSLAAGGAEKVVLDICSNIDSDKFECTVISMLEDDDLLPMFEKKGISVLKLDAQKKIYDFIEVIRFVLTTVKVNNIRVIHAHLVHSAIIATIVKFFRPSIKIIFSSHTINVESKLREFFLWLTRFMREKDILFSMNMKLFFYKSNSVIMPNGIDTEALNIDVPKEEIFTYLAVGRLVPEKNHKLLIQAAKILKDQIGNKFKIWIVGKGILENDLVKLMKETSTEDVIELLGFRKDVAELCNRAHAFLMPSLWEGFPLSILEAGSAGIPIISTPVGSIPSLINKSNGYLSLQENFAAGMKNCFLNYNEAKNKGLKLQSDIKEKYEIKNIVGGLELLYRNAAK